MSDCGDVALAVGGRMVESPEFPVEVAGLEGGEGEVVLA